MPRNKRRTKRRPQRRRKLGFVLTDTTLVKKVLNDPDDEILYSINNGCFSLSGRTVIPIAVTFQIVPTLTNTAVTGNSATNIAVQVQAILNGQRLPMSPFRVISNINPSTFKFSFNAMAKSVPAILTAYDSDSSTNYMALKFSGNQLEASRAMTIRVTHVWRVLPQDDIVVGPV